MVQGKPQLVKRAQIGRFAATRDFRTVKIESSRRRNAEVRECGFRDPGRMTVEDPQL